MTQTLESGVHVAGIAKIGESLITGLDMGHRRIVWVGFDMTSLNPVKFKRFKNKILDYFITNE